MWLSGEICSKVSAWWRDPSERCVNIFITSLCVFVCYGCLLWLFQAHSKFGYDLSEEQSMKSFDEIIERTKKIILYVQKPKLFTVYCFNLLYSLINMLPPHTPTCTIRTRTHTHTHAQGSKTIFFDQTVKHALPPPSQLWTVSAFSVLVIKIETTPIKLS